MRPATRQLASKATEIAIFGAAFLILMNIMGISLTSLAVLGGAVGVGLGFGLQKIAKLHLGCDPLVRGTSNRWGLCRA